MARGKANADPRELEKLEWPYQWSPPWRTDRLLGHAVAEGTLLAAHAGGRLHHAWLLAGPRGIGKATLAWRFARYLLAGQGQGRRHICFLRHDIGEPPGRIGGQDAGLG